MVNNMLNNDDLCVCHSEERSDEESRFRKAQEPVLHRTRPFAQFILSAVEGLRVT